jgi:hypothetical protein
MGPLGFGLIGLGALALRRMAVSTRAPEFYWSPLGFWYAYGRKPSRAPQAGAGQWILIGPQLGHPRPYWRWYP